MQNGGEIARSIYRSGYGLLDDRGSIPGTGKDFFSSTQRPDRFRGLFPRR